MKKVMPKHREGFALVASLTVSAMLLALAMLASACMTLESGCAQRELARARTRLHAQAALRLALGELQAAVGPDRRATADAGVHSADAAHAHWSGVRRTDRLDAEAAGAAPFVWRDAKGALRDRRFEPGSRYDARREVMRWLVSGGEAEAATLRERLRPEDCLTVVGADEANAPVLAPALAAGDGVRFAWWAGDESVKARHNLIAPAPPADPKEAACRFAPPPVTGAGVVLGRSGEAPVPAGFGADGDLALRWNADAATRRKHFHDLTPCSRGVLANQRDGGLRRDLTVFLLSKGEVPDSPDSPPLTDDSPMLGGDSGVFARTGPRFGLLRRWAALGEAADSGAIAPDAGPRRVSARCAVPSDTFHDGTHADLPDLARWSSPVVAPVLTEAAVYLRLGYDATRRRTDGGPWMRLHLYPRVALWNPYDVALAPARYLVHLRVGGSPEFRLVKSGKRLTGRLTGWRVYRNDEVNYATTQGSLVFLLECPAIPAGRSVLFLPGESSLFDVKNPGANRLVPSASQGNAHFRLEDADAFESADLKALAGVEAAGESWRLENSAAEDHAAALKLVPPGAAAADWASPRLYPTVRYISCSHKCGVGTTADPAWPAGVSQPLMDSLEAPPAPMTRDGVRLRRLFETEGNRAAFSPGAHMDAAVLGDHNPLAAYACRHPFDNATPQEPGGRGVRRPEYFGAFTRDAFDADAEWGALAPAGGVSSVPFGRPSAMPNPDSVIAAPLAPGAARLTALSDFGYAPLSPWSWQPLRTLGESRCSPSVPAEASAHGAAEEDWSGMGVGAKHYLDWTRRAEFPGEPLVYDARFEANHALFDGWCLISGDAERRRAFVASGGRETLPNVRLTPAPGVADAAERLTGLRALRRGASAVMTEGAFNINSVSVPAWRALLASSCGATSPEVTPFPRSARAPKETAGADADVRESAYWTRSRGLTSEELDRLAQAMVEEVRRRGPFLSLSDFVNRRPEGGRVSCDPEAPSLNACGALQAAIDRAGVNPAAQSLVISRLSALPGTRHEPEHKAWVRTEGAAARLSQGDVLRALGPVMSARSDTFRLRVVAEAPCEGGGVARVALEAFVQRVPTPVSAHPENPDEPSRATAGLFGRRLVLSGVRELP